MYVNYAFEFLLDVSVKMKIYVYVQISVLHRNIRIFLDKQLNTSQIENRNYLNFRLLQLYIYIFLTK